MSKHTPGPWSVLTEYGDETSVMGIEPNVLWGCGCCGSPNLGLKDAQLIAAAPDLLEALEELMTCKQGELCDHYPAAYKKARAAIAKAKGE